MDKVQGCCAIALDSGDISSAVGLIKSFYERSRVLFVLIHWFGYLLDCPVREIKRNLILD